MSRTVSFGGGLTQSPEYVDPQRSIRQRAMADALMKQSEGPISGWGQGVANLARTAAAGFINNRAGDSEKAARQARAAEMQRIGGSGDPLAALLQSQDPEFQQMGLQFQMAQALKDPAEQDLVQAVGPDGRLTWVPKSQAAGMPSALPEGPKAAPTRTRDVNGMTIQEEMRPDGTWQQIGARPTFAPNAPTQPRKRDIVTLTGPDGKALSLYDDDPRLPDLLNTQGYVEGKPAVAPAGKPGDLPESLKFYTEKAKPYIDAATDTRRQGATIETALRQGNGTGDIAAITSFNKLLDPGAVVREADVSLTLAAQGLADQLAVWVANKQEGDILPAPLREKMGAMAKQIVDTNLAYSKERIMGFRQGAEKYGVDWTDILPPNVEGQLFPAAPVDLGTGSAAASGGNRMGPDDRAQTPYQQKYGITPKAPS